MKNNVTETFSKFLQLIGAKVTKMTADEYLETHPDYNTMVAYVDALEKWNIECAALKISDEQYLEIPTPHITFLKRNGGTFALVKKVTKDTIEWYDTNRGWVKDLLDDFKKDWTKVVLLAETNEQSGDINYKQRKTEDFFQKSRIPFSIFLIIVVLVAYILNISFAFTKFTLPMLLLKLSGVVIATSLLVKSIDANNDFVNQLCNVGKKISCQSILDSKAAKITSWLSWSDMGFIYFASTLISFLLCSTSSSNSNLFFNIQLILSGCGVLFSFYSIYYQGIVIKIWCPLCLGIVVIFWLELITLTLFFLTSTDIKFLIRNDILYIGLISLLIPISFLLLYKNTAINAQKAQKLKSDLIRLKSKPEVFDSLIRNQPKMPFLPQGMGVITLGDINSQHTITMVSNPLCTPCAKMHIRIEKLLRETSNLKCELVFITNPDDIDIGGKLVRKIFSLPPHLQLKSMTEWFNKNDRNFDKWNLKYKDINEKDIASIWEGEHREWANSAQVKKTPTLFYDGFLLPNVIKVEELAYLYQNQHNLVNTITQDLQIENK